MNDNKNNQKREVLYKGTRRKKENSAIKKPESSPSGPPDIANYGSVILPFVLCAICMTIVVVAVVINSCLLPFSHNLLAPVIMEIIAIILPCYLMILAIHADLSPLEQMKAVGFARVRAKHIFFLIFCSFFMMCVSLFLSIIFGGTYASAEGMTILGTFTAGENEYTSSIPYLIVAYALVPAFAEEFLFRGIVFSQLKRVSLAVAISLSSALSALFCFDLGGLIPSLFIGLSFGFVRYSTGSLLACMIVHFLLNLYKLFLETNISAYYLSAQNNLLLLTVIIVATLISAVLFFAESASIYRQKAQDVVQGQTSDMPRCVSGKAIVHDLKAIFSCKPALISAIVCAALFVAVVIIRFVT